MFEETNQSHLLKDVPSTIVRPLPAIYYFSRFIKECRGQKPLKVFQGSVQYLADALELLGEQLSNKSFTKIAFQVRLLMDTKKDDLLSALDEIIVELSEHFVQNREKRRQVMKEIKSILITNYKEMVPPLTVLVVDNNYEEDHVHTVAKRLADLCYYNAITTEQRGPEYQSKVLQSDIVIFASTTPGTVNREIIKLKDIDKPAIALARIDPGGVLDKNAIRHAAQLMRVGYEVLFKKFTPIRLYTSIERNYMKYHLYTK